MFCQSISPSKNPRKVSEGGWLAPMLPTVQLEEDVSANAGEDNFSGAKLLFF